MQLCLAMSLLIPPESTRLNPVLRDLADNHPHLSVRGAALYALAARTKLAAEADGSAEGCREAERLLRRVVAEYPEVRTYHGENKVRAERLLAELCKPAAIGKEAPETKGRALDGTPFDLAHLRGKVVVLAFSGHWCAPCKRMHTVEKRLLATRPRDRVAVIEINSDRPEERANVATEAERKGLRWPIVADGPDGPLAKSWQVTSWPTFVLLDTEQRIRRRATGDIGEKLTAWVDQLLDGPAKK